MKQKKIYQRFDKVVGVSQTVIDTFEDLTGLKRNFNCKNTTPMKTDKNPKSCAKDPVEKSKNLWKKEDVLKNLWSCQSKTKKKDLCV